MHRTTTWIAIAAAATLALTGCSSTSGSTTAPASSADNSISDASPQDILTQATTNAKAQTTVHVHGNGACPTTAFYADMQLRSDEQGTGTVRLGTDTVHLVTTRDAIYVKAPKPFWSLQSSPAAATTVGQKWVRLAKASNPCLAALGSFSAFLTNYLGYPGTPTKTVGGSVFGVPAVALAIAPSISIWVASRGTPLPVRVDDQATGTRISLGEWGTAVSVTVPAKADVVDAAALKQA